jgi:beta-glucanase (GH16 family)
MPTFNKSKTIRCAALIFAVIIFSIGVLYRPNSLINAIPTDCLVQQFDTDPWIVSFKKDSSYCTSNTSTTPIQGVRSGNFKELRSDNLNSIDPSYWDLMNTTFFCNKAIFSPDNIKLVNGGGITLNIERRTTKDRMFTAADLSTKDTAEAKFRFGRFETIFKPAKESGVISSFFLYRFDPWQEIDAEFLGNDTSKMLINVYYNPGQEGDLYNYGLRGTPIVIDLGFDASLDFHRYSIEWEPDEIRWFVDDKLVHVRRDGVPTPIPKLPMRFHVNTWPICSKELAGEFSPTMPVISAELKSVKISGWVPPPQNRIIEFIKSIRFRSKTDEWRESAKWMK